MLAIMISWFGEVAEWSNVPDSKSGVLSKVPRVRIPPSPPSQYVFQGFAVIQQPCYQNRYQSHPAGASLLIGRIKRFETVAFI